MTNYNDLYGPHNYGTLDEQGETIRGIADHLAKEQGKTQRDVWEEARRIFRTVHESEILPPLEEDEG